MGQNQFEAIMPYISENLVTMISEKDNISVTEAISSLYQSKLYEFLEKEETKVWHYSTETLYLLYKQEKKNGKVEFPDV